MNDASAGSVYGFWRFLPGWLVSLCLHFIAMFVLASFVLPVAPHRQVVSLIAKESDSVEVSTQVDLRTADTPLVDAEDLIADFGQLWEDDAPSLSDINLANLLDPSKALETAAGLKGPEFFGVSGYGERYAFVIDRSSSMRGDKFTQACRELIRAADQLSPSQYFYVVFFDRGMLPMFGSEEVNKMLPATAVNLSRLRAWVDQLEVGRGTMPFESVKQSLKLDPDTVYLLTDGQFNQGDKTVSYLTNRNKKNKRDRVKINTIGFVHQDDGTLERLAKQYRGTYRFVAGASE